MIHDTSPHGATLPNPPAPDPTTALTRLAWRDWPALLKRAEAAQVSRCCTRTIARAQASGLLGAVRGRTLIRREDLARWLGVAP